MPDLSIVFGLLLILGSAFLSGLLAKKLNQPLMFGYLFAGLVVSVFLSKFGLKRETIGVLSEIGLALLMFTLGLEFSLKKIEKIRKVVLSGVILQILLTIILGTILLVGFFHLEIKTALVMSMAFSLSSTAIVVKLMQEKDLLDTLPGEIMFGWLLIQDLAVLPLIGFLPILFATSALGDNIFLMLKAVAILLITWLSAGKIVPFLTNLVVSFKNRELLLLFVVTLVFVFALITSAFGFSFALGAFLAGLILSQTHANHAIFSEIRPLKDVFLAIFFVSLGLGLQPSFIIANGGKIILISLLVLIIKVLIVSVILAFFKYHAKTIFQASFGLAQVGEFSFALALTAFSNRFLGLADYSIIVSVTLLTMVLTPMLFWLGEKAYKRTKILCQPFPRTYERFFTSSDQNLCCEELPFSDHVVILGYGRVGKWIGHLLEKTEIPFLVVEYNPSLVRQLKLEGKKVVFGDPTDLNVLDFAQVDRAKIVVLAIPDSQSQKIIVSNCLSLNPNIKIICRSHVEEDFSELKQMGVGEIIQPEFEASLSISHRIMQGFGFNKEEIYQKIKETRNDHEENEKK